MAVIEPMQVVPTNTAVLRAILINSALWTAGHVLTSGGFVSYFGYELQIGTFAITILLSIPELAGLWGLAARPLIRWAGHPQQVWFWSGIAARVVLCALPGFALLPGSVRGAQAAWLVIGTLGFAQALQGISTVAYLSWTSQLVAPVEWSQLLVRRNITNLMVLLVVPVVAGLASDSWKRAVKQEVWSAASLLWCYVVVFSVGICLQLWSMLWLWKLPRQPPQQADLTPSTSASGRWRETLWNRRFRWLLCFAWLHALFAGLTQSAFFLYRLQVLQIGLGTYYLLENVMRISQIAGSGLCEKSTRTWTAKSCLVIGWSMVTASMLVWFWASREQWYWICLVYLLWGGWAGINVCGPEILLRTTPAHDNATAWAFYDRGAGWLAGISGLLGGWWLASLQESHAQWHWGSWTWGPFEMLFAAGFAGRLAAGGCLYFLREPVDTPETSTTVTP